MKTNKKIKVVHMVTTSISIGLMKGQLAFLKKKGYEVTVVSSPGEKLDTVFEDEGAKSKAISMARTISPLSDIVSLFKIIIFFFKEKPDICNAGTPKAGLLGMIAAWVTKVPFKVYTIRGLPFEGASGIKRKILIIAEKIACACADKVICISPSIKTIALEYNLAPEKKMVVFGSGSSNGLQLDKYIYSDFIKNEVCKIRGEYGITEDTFVIGCVGRINNFKGVKELVEAFELLQRCYKNIVLLLVGNKENKDPISYETNERIINNSSIIEVGYQSDPIPYYYLMDVLAFPTYREGFGNVSIEAQATGTPAVVTKATGVIDTIIDNETGILVDIGDVEGLKCALERFIKNPELVIMMGEKGKNMVFEKFDCEVIWNSIDELYKENIDSI